MSFEVVKLEKEHLDRMVEYRGNSYLKEYWSERQKFALAQSPYTVAAIAEGEVLICAGVAEYWQDRAEAWAIFNKDMVKPYFLRIHHACKRYFEVCPFRRIEAAVECDFEPGHRWVKALGFTLEADRLKAYRPTGADCSLYSRVRF